MEAARAERFLNSRAKNPADALCTREEGTCPEKEAERKAEKKGMGGKIKMFGVSFRRTRGQKRLRFRYFFRKQCPTALVR